jgi:hypothetical protein
MGGNLTLDRHGNLLHDHHPLGENIHHDHLDHVHYIHHERVDLLVPRVHLHVHYIPMDRQRQLLVVANKTQVDSLFLMLLSIADP